MNRAARLVNLCTRIDESKLICYMNAGAAMAYGIKNDKRIALATSALLLIMMGRRFLVRPP